MNKALGEIIRFFFVYDRVPFQSSIPMKDGNGMMEWNGIEKFERESMFSQYFKHWSFQIQIIVHQNRFDSIRQWESGFLQFFSFRTWNCSKSLGIERLRLELLFNFFHLWAGLRRVRWCMRSSSYFSFLSAFPISVEIEFGTVLYFEITHLSQIETAALKLLILQM